ncbi:DUF2334 domain-containing protein [Candidatus Thiosymbion oneisti]|uniref:DUF2334 domain-containing protein n=1 Tax=Candidatus Thiosymbion oneisti TaxID=589554 RepID=UPI000A8A05D9|nr:DUF2334 domain-containing protein [Candidatus Thiosymbion oneisti]
MNTQYLIRLDDACPTMDAVKWDALESVLDESGIKPLVAVVPDNKDSMLEIDGYDPAFWGRVLDWQKKGWTIAMHGFQHLFHPIERKRLLMPFYDHSEFAGLSEQEQAKKIRNSWQLFLDRGIEPTVWIAPAHCFDLGTLRALRAETPIRIVNDGIACKQFYEHGLYWIPQQLWALSRKPFGLWTVCLHPNSMTMKQIEAFRDKLTSDIFRSRIISMGDVYLRKRKRSLLDRAYSVWFWQRDGIFRALYLLRNRLGASVWEKLPFCSLV